MRLILVWLAVVAITIAAFVFARAPYLWIDFAIFIGLIVSLASVRGTLGRVILANVSAIVFAIWALEMYQTLKSPRAADLIDHETLNAAGEAFESDRPDAIMGYAKVPGSSGIIRRTKNGEVIYEARFTINGKGLRVGPPDRGGEDIDCILFFGGSFTYGLGLNDEETLPYQVGLMTGGRYRVHNFAVNGYGPHHMLAAAEGGVVDKVVDCRPTYIVYVAIADHINRVGGHIGWGRHSPRYAHDPDQGVVRRGHFDDPLVFSFDGHDLFRLIDRSILYNKVFGGRIRHRDLDLMIPVIDKSRRILVSKYPEAEFHVIVRGRPDHRRVAPIVDRLRALDMNVHTDRHIAPDTALHSQAYRLPGDAHPNALANQIVAEYIVGQIIED